MREFFFYMQQMGISILDLRQVMVMLKFLCDTIMSFLFSFMPLLLSKIEQGELLVFPEHLLQDSWFDGITSWWVSHSVAVKLAIIFTCTSMPHLIHALMGRALLLPAITPWIILTCMLVLHVLFYAHVLSCNANTEAISAANLEWSRQVASSEKILNSTMSRVNEHISTIEVQQLQQVTESQKLALMDQIVVVNNQCAAVEAVANAYVKEQQVANEVLSDIITQGQQYSYELDKSQKAIQGMGASVDRLSIVTSELKDNQDEFASATKRFALLADNLLQTSQSDNKLYQKRLSEHNHFLVFLDKELAEIDSYIEHSKSANYTNG
ncbi:MAG: hypothetical protein ACOVQX_07100 [Legionella sp.]